MNREDQKWDINEESDRLLVALNFFERNMPLKGFLKCEGEIVELRQKLKDMIANPNKYIDMEDD